MGLNAEQFNYISETERLIIRPLKKDDYETSHPYSNSGLVAIDLDFI